MSIKEELLNKHFIKLEHTEEDKLLLIEKITTNSKFIGDLLDSISVVIEKYQGRNGEKYYLVADSLFEKTYLVRDDEEEFDDMVKSLFVQINNYILSNYGNSLKQEFEEEDIVFIFPNEIMYKRGEIEIKLTNKNGFERIYKILFAIEGNKIFINMYDIIITIENYIEKVYKSN